jgi:hypothetical protein
MERPCVLGSPPAGFCAHWLQAGYGLQPKTLEKLHSPRRLAFVFKPSIPRTLGAYHEQR